MTFRKKKMKFLPLNSMSSLFKIPQMAPMNWVLLFFFFSYLSGLYFAKLS